MSKVLPTMMRDQLLNFDVALYDLAMRLCKPLPGLVQNFEHAKKMILQLQQQDSGIIAKEELPTSPGNASRSHHGLVAAMGSGNLSQSEPEPPASRSSLRARFLLGTEATPAAVADSEHIREALSLSITAVSQPAPWQPRACEWEVFFLT